MAARVRWQGKTTPADEDALRRQLQEAIQRGRIVIYDLPRRVRLRLWLTGRVNHAGICLVNHGHERAAVLLWRIFRMW